MDVNLLDIDRSGLDLETLKLTIEFHLQDLNELQEAINGKGKRRAGETTDLETAIAAYEAELASVNQRLADRAMCASIVDAVRQDASAIAEMMQAEEQARQDRQMACSLGGVPQPQARPTSPTFSMVTEPLEEDFIDKLSAIYISNPVGNGVAESSSWAASRSRSATLGTGPNTSVMRECVICTNSFRFYEVATFPCEHHMCKGCLVELFTRLLTDRTLFPPRCCREPIALDKARFLLGPKLVGRYLAKKLEYETENPTYCFQPTCSQFIPPLVIHNNVGMCVKCHLRTCALCKSQAHVGMDCPQDNSTQDVLEMAEREGWKRCYSCHRMVELGTGCNHITCLCGAEFCYVCGERWQTPKACPCELFSEQALMAQAHRHVNRDANGARLPVRERQARVQAAAQYLLQNHECVHNGRWTSRRGRHQCEECRDWLPEFIYECQQCRVLACRRCRFNRL
ncbi:hypothetical protein B0T20DRAFT_357038 [Sordaria brevicollis]|uniref:RBR-type E3 ubiquitin transferase n=1 Tax=Sordaria brevicollis TaxID=83679 RepID=A0AAE0PBJ2_SORBR|nr:hypothetical protein B0T20DRAFT_357038 [Sordaria brevicollis]